MKCDDSVCKPRLAYTVRVMARLATRSLGVNRAPYFGSSGKGTVLINVHAQRPSTRPWSMIQPTILFPRLISSGSLCVPNF